jgi:hypothetical protein
VATVIGQADSEAQGGSPTGPVFTAVRAVDSRWTRTRVLIALMALLLVSTGVALTAAAAGRLTLSDPLRQFRAAALRISDGKQGKPLFRVFNFYPGDVARSRVRIRNTSKVPGVLYLRLRNLRNTPLDQPQLSDKLWLRIWWRKANGRTHRVWAGPLTKFHRVRACVLRPGQARVFRFSVRFYAGWRRPAPGDNSVMGHRTRFGLVWKIVPRR